MGERRSRSPPARWDSERISRTVVAFGRYPEKRPSGLRVNDAGAMSLESLLDCWGSQKGVGERDVLDAVRLHMFQRDGGSALRFAVVQDEAGCIFIRVLPRREGREGDMEDDDRPPGERRRHYRRPMANSGSGDGARGGASTAMISTAPRPPDFSAYPRAGSNGTSDANGGASRRSMVTLAYSMAHLPRQERRARRVGVFGDPPPPLPGLEVPDVPMLARLLPPPPPPPPPLPIENLDADDKPKALPPPAPKQDDGEGSRCDGGTSTAPVGVAQGTGSGVGGSDLDPEGTRRRALAVEQKLDLPLEVLIVKDEEMGRS